MRTEYSFHTSRQELNLNFYEEYDESFLIRKANSLLLIADNAEEFKSFASNVAGYEETIDDKYIQSLRAEVHFTEFHQFEAFFAILSATFQDLPHWLYLTTYPPGDIKVKAESWLKGDLQTITAGQSSNKKDFVHWAVYAGHRPNRQGYEVEWDANLNNIILMIDRLAKKYLDFLDAYNSYKHGLRVLTGATFFTIRLENESQDVLHHAESKDSLRFLKLESEGKTDGVHTKSVHQVYAHFNPIESMNHLEFMHLMIKNARRSRLALLRKEPLDEVFKVLTINNELALGISSGEWIQVSM